MHTSQIWLYANSYDLRLVSFFLLVLLLRCTLPHFSFCIVCILASSSQSSPTSLLRTLATEHIERSQTRTRTLPNQIIISIEKWIVGSWNTESEIERFIILGTIYYWWQKLKAKSQWQCTREREKEGKKTKSVKQTRAHRKWEASKQWHQLQQHQRQHRQQHQQQQRPVRLVRQHQSEQIGFSHLSILAVRQYIWLALADSVPVAVRVCRFRLWLLKMSSPFMNNRQERGRGEDERKHICTTLPLAGTQPATTKTAPVRERASERGFSLPFLPKADKKECKQERAQRQTGNDDELWPRLRMVASLFLLLFGNRKCWGQQHSSRQADWLAGTTVASVLSSAWLVRFIWCERYCDSSSPGTVTKRLNCIVSAGQCGHRSWEREKQCSRQWCVCHTQVPVLRSFVRLIKKERLHRSNL